jgi:hypothetical protein
VNVVSHLHRKHRGDARMHWFVYDIVESVGEDIDLDRCCASETCEAEDAVKINATLLCGRCKQVRSAMSFRVGVCFCCCFLSELGESSDTVKRNASLMCGRCKQVRVQCHFVLFRLCCCCAVVKVRSATLCDAISCCV